MQQPDLSPRVGPWVIAVTVLVVFARLFTSDWTTWDDESFIAKNPTFVTATAATLGHFWVHPFYDLYIPLTATLWAAVAMAARSDFPDARGIVLNPYLFHAVNIFVHAAASIVVYFLLHREFKKTWPALAGALVFALHPVQVESVAWISGLKDVLAGGFSVAAIAAYLEAARDTTDGRRRRRWFIAAVVSFTLAIFAKPSAMTTAGILVAIDVLLLRRPLKTIAVWIIPFGVMALASAAWARHLQPVIPGAHDVPLWGRPLIVGHSLAFYLGKIVWPAKLAVDYGRHPAAVWRDGHVFLAWIVPAILLAMALLVYRKWRWPLVALAIFVIAPLHTLGLVGFDFQFFSTTADHYLYTAILGVAVLAAWAVSLLPRQGTITVTVVVALAMGIRSYVQTAAWKDSPALYANTLAVNPNSWAIRASLAAAAMEQRDFPTAARLASEVIRGRPEYPVGYLTLGAAKREMGDLAGAEEAFRQSLAIARKVETLNNLGALLATQKRYDEADRLLRESLAYDPFNATTYLNLGLMQIEQNRAADAIRYLKEAIRHDPRNAQAHFLLGQVLFQTGDRPAGVRHLQQANHLQPQNPAIADVLRQLGVRPVPAP